MNWLAVEWSDLDWDRSTLEISKSLEETDAGLRLKGTKSGETRRFAIPAKVVEALKRAQTNGRMKNASYTERTMSNRGLIFCRPEGDYLTPSNFGKRVSKVMRAAGLTGITLHSLRHTHASELLSQGAPITAVAARLGHASPNITLGSIRTNCRSTIRLRPNCGTTRWETSSRKAGKSTPGAVGIKRYQKAEYGKRNSNKISELGWSGRRDLNPEPLAPQARGDQE